MRTDRGLLWGYEKTYSRQWKKGHPGEAEKLAAEALDGGMDLLRIVEEAMMPAMRSAGERYKNEETDMLRILAPAGSGAYGR